MSSSTAATQGEVAKETAAAGGAWLIAMVLARLVTMAVSAAICCANSAFLGVLLAIVDLGICDCLLVLGGMVGTCFAVVASSRTCLADLTSLTSDECLFLT